VVIKSASGARAILDGLSGATACVSSACGAGGSGCRHVRPFGLPRGACCLMHILGCLDMWLGLGDAQAVGLSRAGSVSGLRVDRAAALNVLESSFARASACVASSRSAHMTVTVRARGPPVNTSQIVSLVAMLELGTCCNIDVLAESNSF
jgi:hypothetical protein